LRTDVRAELSSIGAILKKLLVTQANLVMMGVGSRPGERQFFGATAAAAPEMPERSLLLVAN